MQLYREPILNVRGEPVFGAVILVKTSTGTLATLFAADGSPLSNPVTTNNDGEAPFRAANGNYTVTVSGIPGAGITARTVAITLNDPDDVQPATRDATLAQLAAPSAAAGLGFMPSGTGAQPTTLQKKARESLSVDDFFLAGESDWTGSIRRGVNRAIVLGCDLNFVAGKDYTASDQIVIDTTGAPNSSFKIKGNGARIVLPAGDIAAFNTSAFDANGRSAGGLFKIITPDVDNKLFAIDGLSFYKPDYFGTFINITIQRNVNVRNCVFEGGDVQVLATRVYGCYFDGNTHTMFNKALWLRGACNTSVVINNRFRNGRIALHASSHLAAETTIGIHIHDNYFESLSNDAIRFNGVRYSSIHDNYFEAVDQAGTTWIAETADAVKKVAIYFGNGLGTSVDNSSRNTISSLTAGSSNLYILMSNGSAFLNLFDGTGPALIDVGATTYGMSTSGTLTALTLQESVAGGGIAIVGRIKMQSEQVAVLGNGWTNVNAAVNGPASYWRDPFGIVHLSGMITGGSVNLAAFTLPAGYCPTYEMQLAISSNDLFGQLRITQAGAVIPRIASAAGNTNLNGISFRAYGY